MSPAQQKALDWLKSEGGVQRAGTRFKSFQALRLAGLVEHVFDSNRSVSSGPKWLVTVSPILGASYVRLPAGKP